jgi:Ca-activated chloride channel homolog
MTFTWPLLLLLMLFVPLAIWFVRRSAKGRVNTATAYADANLLPNVLSNTKQSHSRWPLNLQLIALALLLFSAARPVGSPPLPVNKAAVMIALDTSKSMQATDVNPSRLEVAKEIIKEFIKLAPGSTMIGLATFSDSAAIVVPATTDRTTLLEKLKGVKVAANTSLADAVVGSVRSLPGRKTVEIPSELLGLRSNANQPKPQTIDPSTGLPIKPVDPATLPPGAILLLSDGTSNVSADPQLAAKFAKQYKVKLYTVAVGKEGGAVMKIDGKDYFVPFTPKTLESMALETEGKFVFPPEKAALEKIYKELGTVTVWEATKLELGGILSGLAVVLMLTGAGLSLHWQRRIP